MNSRHPQIPRLIWIIFGTLITITFLTGTLHAFASAKIGAAVPPSAAALRFQTTPEPTTAAADAEALQSADTLGIIGLGALLMVILFFGILWGNRVNHPRQKKEVEKQG